MNLIRHIPTSQSAREKGCTHLQTIGFRIVSIAIARQLLCLHAVGNHNQVVYTLCVLTEAPLSQKKYTILVLIRLTILGMPRISESASDGSCRVYIPNWSGNEGKERIDA